MTSRGVTTSKCFPPRFRTALQYEYLSTNWIVFGLSFCVLDASWSEEQRIALQYLLTYCIASGLSFCVLDASWSQEQRIALQYLLTYCIASGISFCVLLASWSQEQRTAFFYIHTIASGLSFCVEYECNVHIVRVLYKRNTKIHRCSFFLRKSYHLKKGNCCGATINPLHSCGLQKYISQIHSHFLSSHYEEGCSGRQAHRGGRRSCSFCIPLYP